MIFVCVMATIVGLVFVALPGYVSRGFMNKTYSSRESIIYIASHQENTENYIFRMSENTAFHQDFKLKLRT